MIIVAWHGITEATLPWVVMFTVILVGSSWGFGQFLVALTRPLGSGLRTLYWNLYDAYWNRRDRRATPQLPEETP